MSGSNTHAQCLVVSGFLGSGKTTLVRRLLEAGQATGIRTAVISNEFGELGIDQALLGDSAAEYVELAGGCVCCKLSDDLLVTLEEVWQRSRPERVIVETSGVALPYDTLINFWRDPVRAWSTDEIAIVVASAEQIATGRDLAGTFEDQVSSADLIVLSKIDLVDEADALRAEQFLSELQPDAPIIRSLNGDADPALLFPPDPGGTRAERRDLPAQSRPHTHEHFETHEIQIAAGTDPGQITERLAALGALRVKGFIETADGVQVVQGVGPRIELSPVTEPVAAEMLGRLVVIRRADGCA
ncbi:MAG: cobalamin biosynthesis protein CobW [Hyphomicrobiaceae bacterium]|jgi:cobalamin biosynthesis protein CobW